MIGQSFDVHRVSILSGFLGKLKADPTATLPSHSLVADTLLHESAGHRVLWLVLQLLE